MRTNFQTSNHVERALVPTNLQLYMYITFFVDNSPTSYSNYHWFHQCYFTLCLTVLQYGFATMFVAAFPLGPLFALLTSVIRIRVDAVNFVSQFRRPDITHAKNIGAWYRILKWVTKISVLVNAFLLAFTSEFIPKLLYRLKYAPDHDSGGASLTGYINNSLSSIHTADIFRSEPGTEPENPHDNLSYNSSVCR